MTETLTDQSPRTVAHDPLAQQFATEGYVGPIRIMSEPECRQFLTTLRANPAKPLDWSKGLAATSRSFYEIGTHPAIINVLKKLMGPDIMLWGASTLTRKPGAVHPWHSDIETADCSGKTVSVWLGLENATRDSSLLLISRSHHFKDSVQEARHHHGKARNEMNDEVVTQWGLDRDPTSRLTKLDGTDGEALFFDGRLWHGSNNLSDKVRTALLLQYATPDADIYMPDMKYLEWPFKKIQSPRPPCVMVSGTDTAGENRIVPGPASGSIAPPRNRWKKRWKHFLKRFQGKPPQSM